MSSVLSYLSLTICRDFIAVCSQIEPAVAFDLRLVLIGIAVAVVAACLIFAGFILTKTKEDTAANERRSHKTSVREIMPEEEAKKTAIPKETRELVAALAPESTIEGGVLTPLKTATAESITAAEEAVLTGPRLQVEEPSQKKQPTEMLTRQHQQTTVHPDITELKINPVEARPGDTITISCKLTNMNDIPVYCVVTLKINGMVVANKGISLVRRSAVHMNFTVVATVPGDYKVEVNSLTGRLTILGEMQQTSVCPSCGSQNDGGYQFCGGCGIRLAVGEQPQAYKNQQIYSCPTCGQTVVNGLKFCTSCGTPLK